MERPKPSRLPQTRRSRFQSAASLAARTRINNAHKPLNTRTMPASRVLRLLRPLLKQSFRLNHSCQSPGTPPPCPPCESAPPPPCRAATAAPLPARRVVCCPPPQGKRPPCAEKEPLCSLTCAHQLPQANPKQKGAKKLCGADRDVVSQRHREYEEHHRRVYEHAVQERKARPPTPPSALKCPQPPEKKLELATDGRMYAVASDGNAPRCTSTPKEHNPHCPTTRDPHPPPQPVKLEPLVDCRPKERPIVDPCAHTPRTLLSIDRGDTKPKQEHSSCHARSTSQKPVDHEQAPKPVQENPKSQTDKSYKGLTSRIMNSLRSGRASPPKPKPEWCSKPPPLASAPQRCRQPTLTERMRRGSPSRGKRHLHTAVNMANKDAPKAPGSEAALEASRKLAAALSERDTLKEAGRGRAVRSPQCAPPIPPPPPRPTGGAMEFSVPAGADTVCVRVSMGKAPTPKTTSSATTTSKTIPPSSPTSPRPPCSSIPRPSQSASDSWLSIKKLQQKISSSCNREAPPPAPSAPARPPPPCSPQGRAKMVDVLPHTIFVK